MPTDRETAKVYFTKVEMNQVKAAAGYESVSGFIRRMVLGSLNGITHKGGESAGRVPEKHRDGAKDRAKSPGLARPEGNLESVSESRGAVPPVVDSPSSEEEDFGDPENYVESELCDHGAEKNKCKVMHCYFYFEANGRATRAQYEAAKARKQVLLFASPEGEDEVHQSEDVRRDRDVPAPGRRAAKNFGTSRKAKNPKSKRGRGGDDQPQSSRKCAAAVGPGIYCPKCSRRH